MPKKQVGWRIIKPIFKIIATLLFIYLISIHIDYAKLRTAIGQVHVPYLLLALALTPVIILCKILKWYLLISGLEIKENKFRVATKSFLIGLAFAFVTPFASGELARGFFINFTSRIKLLELTIRDKIYDFLSLMVYVVGGLCLIVNTLWLVLCLVFAILLLLCLLFFLNPLISKYVFSVVAYFGKNHSFENKDLNVNKHLTHQQNCLYVFINLFGFFIFFIQQALILYAFLGWIGRYYTVLPIVTFSTILPITIGGFGIREWTAVILLQRFNISAEVALNATLTHQMIVMVIPSIIGFILLLKNRPLVKDSY